MDLEVKNKLQAAVRQWREREGGGGEKRTDLGTATSGCIAGHEDVMSRRFLTIEENMDNRTPVLFRCPEGFVFYFTGEGAVHPG